MSLINREQWSSNFVFVIAAVGSAVGLGNIWRFPYIMGKYGGAVFLLVYLFFILFFCSVPLICELCFGKYAKKENVGAYALINPKFKFLGWLNVFTTIIISSFYLVVGGWIVKYISISLFSIGSIKDYTSYFSSFVSDSISAYVFTCIFLLICMFFIYRGVNKGIALGNKIMMPVFLIILIILCFVSISLPGASKGLEFMFKPDISKISFEMMFAALGQSFFTLSIGTGVLLVYGSYMKSSDNPIKSAYTIIFSDTLFALLAGIMIFPAVFSFGVEASSGPELVFVTLPKIFSQIKFGNFVSLLFFILLLFAALTSQLSIIEPQVAVLTENFKLTRKKATLIVFVILLFLTVPTSLSFGVLKDVKIFSKTFFDLFDYISSNILLPGGALALCITLGWFSDRTIIFRFKNRKVHLLFLFMLRYIVPPVLIIIIIGSTI